MASANTPASGTHAALAPALAALVAGDFSAVASRFSTAGFAVTQPARGVLQVRAARADSERASVLLSVGVHGDETGPIEMLAQLLETLSLQPQALAVDLMVCVGHLEAIEAGKRFIEADLNRMFRPERDNLAMAVEAARADVLIGASADFFADAGPQRWHLDLHTAIRPSFYPTFAVVPDLLAPEAKAALTDWLGAAAIGAIIMNPVTAGTYSYYCAEHFGAAASTVELGRVGTLGQNDLAQFAVVARALDALLRATPVVSAAPAPHVFAVAQQIIKLSDDFRMTFDRATQNFTALPPGAVIATDGASVYKVGAAEELVVFPNPDVQVGLRAGLMVVRIA